MILSESQKTLKKEFRKAAIYAWRKDRTMNFVPGFILIEAKGESSLQEVISLELLLNEIPSIGVYFGIERTRVWLARHFPKTSNALFNKKTDDQVIAIWAKEKRTSGNDCMISAAAQANELNRKKCTKFIRARSLSKKTDWHTVK